MGVEVGRNRHNAPLVGINEKSLQKLILLSSGSGMGRFPRHSHPPYGGLIHTMKDIPGPLKPEQWVDEHGDYLYRYTLVRVRTPDIAQDIVQETFLAAIRSVDKFAGRSSERSWLFGILKNKIVDHYRSIGRETSFTDMEFCQDEFAEKFVPEGDWVHVEGPRKWKPEPDAVMHRNEFWMTMRECLAKMPRRAAEVFMLREMDDVESKEICTRLSISENNLWTMLHRARMSLRECLEKNWFNR
jgi:RNA polymerase sigma-70 factor (ECF subfamily)